MATRQIEDVQRGADAFKKLILDPANWNKVANYLNNFRLSGSGGIQCRKTGDGWTVGFAGSLPAQAEIYQTIVDPNSSNPPNFDGGYYPPAPAANVYYCTATGAPQFTQQSGEGGITTQEQSNPAKQYVMNLGSGYVPWSSYIPVWTIAGQGFTVYNGSELLNGTLTQVPTQTNNTSQVTFTGVSQIFYPPCGANFGAFGSLPVGLQVECLLADQVYTIVNTGQLWGVATVAGSDIAPGATATSPNATLSPFGTIVVQDPLALGALVGQSVLVVWQSQSNVLGRWVLCSRSC